MTHFMVCFRFADDREDANTQDFRDELMEYFEQAVLEGRMTDVLVVLDHTRNPKLEP